MPGLTIPDLTFPGLSINKKGGESPIDFRMFLYRGGAAVRKNRLINAIKDGSLGQPIIARLPLVEKLHQNLLAHIAKGGSKRTLISIIERLRVFYTYVDTAKLGDPTKNNVTHFYVSWTEWNAKRVDRKEIASASGYRSGVFVGNAIAKAIDVTPNTLFRAARLERNSGRKAPVASAAEKQSLEESFVFGRALLDIAGALSIEAIRGPMPISIKFRTGQIIEEWCGPQKKPLELLSTYGIRRHAITFQKAKEQRERWMADSTNRNRSTGINLRIEAELLIFISQTAMNLAQTRNIRVGDFRYESNSEGYGIRRYKNRRMGEVEFHIYREYRNYFERYLDWRKAIFPDDPDGLLFPFLTRWGTQGGRPGAMTFAGTTSRLKALGVALIGPQKLRQTRINWILRHLNDPSTTAEVHGHSVEILHSEYERPSYQRALIEATLFWRATDPALTPPGPGACVEKDPVPLPDKPSEAPSPDCQGAGGCLFCVHQRDLDSFDHVWSLASLRYLKSLELARNHMPAPKGSKKHPALVVIERITQKLDWLAKSNAEREVWVEEAGARMREESYHRKWAGWILMAEMVV
ncbi:site-specific integrase [Rhodanobacter sp. Root561]|uniref:site-specific integrase n=1 Tax=Rhodanobacter sp. Root561 TaxID=1736560 RepID=UPI000A70D87D|nr:site-specific integrase [Rhodanobacter sp. Root561]